MLEQCGMIVVNCYLICPPYGGIYKKRIRYGVDVSAVHLGLHNVWSRCHLSCREDLAIKLSEPVWAGSLL